MKILCCKCKTTYEFRHVKPSSSYKCRNCRAVESIKRLMSIDQSVIQEILKLYRSNHSCIQIARQLGIGKFTVLKYLERNGIKRRPPKFKHVNTIISPTEGAWLAGFIDGEGHFGVMGKKSGHKLKLAISNANKESILKIKEMSGGGFISVRYNSRKNPKWSDIFTVRIMGDSLRHVLNYTKDFYVVKREHVKSCLEWYNLLDKKQLSNEQKLKIKQRLQLLARNGFKLRQSRLV